MREETVLLKGQDGVIIRVVYTRGGSNDAVVYMPFFMGNHRNATPHRIAQAFPRRYGRPWVITIDSVAAVKGYRSLSEPGITLTTHIDDLKVVLAYFRDEMGVTGSFHLIGHSLMAFTVIKAGADPAVRVTSAILLDGSDPDKLDLAKTYGLRKYRGDPIPGAASELRISILGSGLVVAESYLHDVEGFRVADYAAEWSIPTLVVAAGDGDLKDAARAYHRQLRPSRLEIIDGVDHFFVSNPRGFDRLTAIAGAWIWGGYLAA